jgi:hypothetical protein
MDACREEASISSGTNWLMPVDSSGIAKMDAYLVKMHVFSEGSGPFGGDCKERTL